MADFSGDEEYYTDDNGDQYHYEYDDDDDDEDEPSDGYKAADNDVLMPHASVPSIKAITQESLLAAQREDLHKVMDLLSLKEHHARTLLIHYRWDVDKVITVFVEYGKDKLFAAAGVQVLEHNPLFSYQSSSSNISCEICFEDVFVDSVTVMDCGHFFCNDCWTAHFVVMINEGNSRRIKCMAHKCNAVCDEVKIRALVSRRDPDLSEKFDRRLLESYIEDNKRVKWCPSVPNCGNAIRIEDDEFCEVECPCGMQFCFSCLSEAHSPCTCNVWELWCKKNKDESETKNWVTLNTKPCPHCRKPVEKNGGCNHVRCVCGKSFCWVCAGPTGAGHSCGRYKEDTERRDIAKRNHDRYMHYYNRYKAHMDSLKLECKLKETITDKISKLEEKFSAAEDFKWITNGLYRLFRSRRILSYSYAFAYFMFDDNLFRDEISEKMKKMKKNLFEDQQQQFEFNVEKLSSVLEEKWDSYSDNDIVDLRLRTISLTVATDNLCRNLYECIETDLLGSFRWSVQRIAPYRSKGLEKASS